ncbi:MAG: DNA repair protein RecN [candidate division KSB1 bacterium]|nr:DNA repair protein RecN [candidate division KSB1 bacterium]
MNRNGRTRSFINDSPVPLKVLSSLGDLLVDVHGQHEHQLLLRPREHVFYLDAYAKNEDLRQSVALAYRRLKALQKELDSVIAHQQELEQSRDYIEFQLKEISKVAPMPDEDSELEKQERILSNSQYLYEKVNAIYNDFYEKNGAVVEVIKGAENSLKNCSDIDSKLFQLVEECESARIAVQDVAESLREYTSKITFDSSALERIQTRLAALNGLKKKYAPTIQEILDKKQLFENELGRIDNVDETIKSLENKMGTVRDSLTDFALKLSEKRNSSAEYLAQNVNKELLKLGMEKASFSVDNKQTDTDSELYVQDGTRKLRVTENGIDHIEFLISSNPGEPPRPLAKIASGGEISRVMLALKSLLAEADNVPVLIFDEIDAGVSGRIAQSVGVSLRKLAQSHQILCITHLPQIASMAHTHFVVEKYETDGTTNTQIQLLDYEQRIENIARLMGGKILDDSFRNSAAALIQQAEEISD